MLGAPPTQIEVLSARRAAFGLSLFFGCLFAGHGVAMPYLNPWMASRGVGLDQLATIASLAAVVRIIAGPLVAFLADRLRAHRLVLIAAAWATFLAWLLLAQGDVFWHFLAGQMLIALTGAALIPLGDAMATAGMRAGKLDYGRVRLWGSLTFLVATLFGGHMVERFGLDAVIVYLVVAAIATALSTLLLPGRSGIRGRPIDAGLKPPPHARGLRVKDVVALVATPMFAGFLLVAGLAQASHAALYVYSTLHWQAHGISPAWCGALWAMGVAAEIVLFWFGARLPQRVSALVLLAIGLGVGVIRWTAMGFDPPLAALVPLQLLHAATYGAAHLGAMQFIARAVPAIHAGSAQSAYAVASGGLGMALATQAAGAVYVSAGGRAYWAMAILAAIGFTVCIRLAWRWDGQILSVAGSPASGRD